MRGGPGVGTEALGLLPADGNVQRLVVRLARGESADDAQGSRGRRGRGRSGRDGDMLVQGLGERLRGAEVTGCFCKEEKWKLC